MASPARITSLECASVAYTQFDTSRLPGGQSVCAEAR